MKETVTRDIRKPTKNITRTFEPDEVLIQPEDPDEHFLDGEDEIDWDTAANDDE